VDNYDCLAQKEMHGGLIREISGLQRLSNTERWVANTRIGRQLSKKVGPEREWVANIL
jgi:hypothetical protein